MKKTTVLAAFLCVAVSSELCAVRQDPGGVSINGVAIDSVANEAIPFSVAVIPELELRVIADRNGRFVIENLDVPQVWLTVVALGYWSRTVRIDLSGGDVELSLALIERVIELEPIMVATGSARERMLDESLHPTSVLRGQDLAQRFDVTLAATLDGEPGVTATSMGPATGQPVIRGLSGDRVLVLEDGQRSGDLSSSGPDHAVAADAISAQRIEVVRGPAALLYGSNALGGVINVIREEVPSKIPARAHGAVVLQGQSMNRGFGANVLGHGAIGKMVMRGEFNSRITGDFRTPVGVLPSTDIDNLEGSVGASVVSGWGHLGAAYRYLNSSYGIPGSSGAHSEGVRTDVSRHAVKAESRIGSGWGMLDEIDIKAGWTRYEHEEWEPGGILGTRFIQYTSSGEFAGHHGRAGPFSFGSVGMRASFEEYTTDETQETPPSRRYGIAGYVLEEIDLERLKLEFGGRFDWTRISPLTTATTFDIGDVRIRDFTALSGSVGMLYDVGGDTKLGLTLARAFRTPGYVELFSQGPHLAAYSFEVGNPDLELERGTGADVFLRANTQSLELEVAGFYNRISNYVFPRATGEMSRLQLPVFQYTGEDAEMIGAEGDVNWTIVPGMSFHGSASYVRGTLVETDEPLPLIPPLIGGVGLRYDGAGFYFGADVKAAAEQNRVGEFEDPTDGYTLLNGSAGVQWFKFGWLHSVTLRADNLTDATYRNHLSRIKDIMPEAGRSVTLVYRVDF